MSVSVNPYNNTVYVANSEDNTVSVIDAKSNTVTFDIPVGKTPNSLSVNTSYDVCIIIIVATNLAIPFSILEL
jgi:YVTN family beta-propeller protein